MPFAMQRAQHQHHRDGNVSPAVALPVPPSHHVPAVYLHTASPLSQTKLGRPQYQQHAPLQQPSQQAAVPLQDEPLLIQARKAYAGVALVFCNLQLLQMRSATVYTRCSEQQCAYCFVLWTVNV